MSGQAEIEDMFEDAEFSLKQKISRERQRIQDEEMEQVSQESFLSIQLLYIAIYL